MVHLMLRVSDVMYKWKSRLADVTFDWRHVMETAVERNNQNSRFITFRCVLYKIYSKTSQTMNKNDIKNKV